jgi:hypothetical protein
MLDAARAADQFVFNGQGKIDAYRYMRSGCLSSACPDEERVQRECNPGHRQAWMDLPDLGRLQTARTGSAA